MACRQLLDKVKVPPELIVRFFLPEPSTVDDSSQPSSSLRHACVPANAFVVASSRLSQAVRVYRAYRATKNKQIDLNASIAIENEPRTGRRTDKSCVPAFFFLNENKFYFAYESKCVSKCLLLPFHFFSYFGSRCYLFVSEMEKIN